MSDLIKTVIPGWPTKPLLRAALTYIDEDMRIVPVHFSALCRCSCEKPDCKSPAAHEMVDVREGSHFESQMREWWGQWPMAIRL